MNDTKFLSCVDRNTISNNNIDQVIYKLKKYIFNKNITKTMMLVRNMYDNNLSEHIYNTCIYIYIYYCCIYTPDYLNILLYYENNVDYYKKLVLYLIHSPKNYIFNVINSNIHDYFFLHIDYICVNKSTSYTNINVNIERAFDNYYNSIKYYLSNINLKNQVFIHADFANLLYYLNNFHDYDNYVVSIWNAQFSIFTNKKLLEYVQKLHLLHNYTQNKKFKLMLLLYSLLFKFLDIGSVLYLFKNISILVKKKL
jgi:hypothetical protein